MQHATKSPSDQQRGRLAQPTAAPSAAGSVVDSRPSAIAQRELADGVSKSPKMIAHQAATRALLSSPRLIAQGKRFGALFGGAAQLHSDPAAVSCCQEGRLLQREGPEAEELVQQPQGRVKPAIQLKDGVPVNPLQFKKTEAQSDQVSRMYEKEIEATKTKDPIEHMGSKEKCPNGGLFITDTESECGSLELTEGRTLKDLRVTLPDLDEPFNLSQESAENRLTEKQNCQLIAEHELVHVKHTWENRKYQEKSAKTYLEDFRVDGKFEETWRNLYIKLPTGEKHEEGPWLYIETGLSHIRGEYEKRGVNNEAPAVMRHLNRYLDLYQNIAGEAAYKLYEPLHNAIRQYDQMCSAILMGEGYSPYKDPHGTEFIDKEQERLEKVKEEAGRLKNLQTGRLLKSLVAHTGKVAFNPFEEGYAVAKENCNLRDEGKTFVEEINKADTIKILEKHKANSKFKIYFSEKEHYWVRSERGSEGWVRTDAIVENI